MAPGHPTAGGSEPTAEQHAAARVLSLEAVTTRTAFIKCMGRTFTATALDAGVVALVDATDITRPLPLGTARRSSDSLWDIHLHSGRALFRTADLLPALATLREALSTQRSLRTR